MKGISKGNKGFSLIELLVVIAIIAILAAVLFPIMIKAKNQAKITQCLSNLKQLGSSMHMYLGDNGGKFPVPNLQAATSVGDTYGTVYMGQRPLETTALLNYAKKYAIWGQLFPYVKNRMVWVCPTKGGAATGDLVLGARFTSYEYRRYFGVGFTPWAQTESVLEPTRMKVLSESSFAHPSKAYMLRENAPYHDYRLEPLSWIGGQKGFPADSTMIFCFVDGHAKTLPISAALSPEKSTGNGGWDVWWPRIGGYPTGYMGAKRDID